MARCRKTGVPGPRARAAGAVLALAVLAAPPARAAGGLDAAVRRAVQRGRRWLLAVFKRPDFPDQGYPMGMQALALYALMAAGHNPEDPFIAKRFDRLASMPKRRTYSVALAVLALDARHRARAAKQGREKPGPIGGADRNRMQACLGWLLAHRWKGEGVWSYGPGVRTRTRDGRPDHDHSNTQFAVMAIEVALRNHLNVPSGVLEEIGRNFLRSRVHEGRLIVPAIIAAPPQEGAPAPLVVPPVPVRPAGWGYKGNAGDRGRPPLAQPTMSMTAAGLSCLLVVRHGLTRMGRSAPTGTGKAIRESLAWIIAHLRKIAAMRGRPRGIFRDYYYTIYTLEKVADLGGIARFGRYDWYRIEAAYLVRTQKPHGYWGTWGADRHVHTAFALLFLARASAEAPPPPLLAGKPRPPYVVPAPPVISKGAEGEAPVETIFVDRLGAHVSLPALFRQLRAGRRARDLLVAREAVRNVLPDARPHLVPHLVPLLGGHADSVAAFARNALASVTGIRRGDAEAYGRWYRQWGVLRAIGRDRDRARADEALAVLRSPSEPLSLKETALWALSRAGGDAVAAELAELLPEAPRPLREPLHRALCHLSGRDRAFRAAEWDAVVAGWRAWRADRARAEAATARALRARVEALAKADPAQAEAALAAVVAAGPRAVPEILRCMDAPVYRIELVLALERITGKRLGLGREAWAAWWARRGTGGDGRGSGGRPSPSGTPRASAEAAADSGG